MYRLILTFNKNMNLLKVQESLALALAKTLLDQNPANQTLFGAFFHSLDYAQFRKNVQGLAADFKQAADAAVIAGMLAMEAGDINQANLLFQSALTVWKNESTAASGGGLDFNGRPIAQASLETMAKALTK
jgi:hypothetical protein